MAKSIKISTGSQMRAKSNGVCIIINGQAYTVNQHGQVSAQQKTLHGAITVFLTESDLLNNGLKEQLRQALPWVKEVLDKADQERAKRMTSDRKVKSSGPKSDPSKKR